ncbi:prepilin peptidase [Methylohalobius crimeensis]|uniref:prepilin peptidase n=1 Tax=Methylohalobius crimeensis TaxID=244365 RepID=UPI0003B69587|nr:A24 family peptidase [Methylohalobius crimeensis]
MSLLEALQQNPVLFFILIGVTGLLVGSFLNVVILRLPKMLERDWRRECLEFLDQPIDEADGERFDLVYPPSTCPRCGHKIRPWENIPILSYLFLRRRCSVCGTRISPRYPLIEGLTAVMSFGVAWRFGADIQTLWGLVFTWGLIALTFIDFDHQLLPDNLTLPLLWLGLVLSLFEIFTDPPTAIMGAAAGYGLLWSVYQLFRLVTGKEGMGYGDFKLLAAAGAWLGWQMLPLMILLSSLAGAVIGVGLTFILGRDKNIPMPFGPYLAIAAWIALLWGKDLNRLYFQLSGIG